MTNGTPETNGETGAAPHTRPLSEMVGRFAERAPFEAALKELLEAGFASSDLSVLDTREAISAAEPPGETWRETLSGLVGEINFVGPITDAGLIAIATGPVGVAVAAAVAAGLTGAALTDLLATVRATPHAESVARALEAGALMLWVRADSEPRQARAREILSRHGAEDIHLHTRPASLD